MRRLATAALPALAALGLLAPVGAGAAPVLPAAFRDTVVPFKGLTPFGLAEPTAIRFSSDGRVFVAQKSGQILVYDGLADQTPTLFADLRTDVYDSGDRGLLGLALDPSFPARPYVYALYTYDHLLGEAALAPRWGTPGTSGDSCPKPGDAAVDACPVSGRLVRLTAVGDQAGAELPLVEGWCQQFSSHSVGDLEFGPEGALYASGGDGASFTGPDIGQFGWPQLNQCGDPPGAVGQPLTAPTAEGGALRAQRRDDLDGSVIRIDPETGEGVAGNPLFASANANTRRLVAKGFRNPFRFAIDPETDEVYVDNVGWGSYEEMDRVDLASPQLFNSGWPCYEGPGPNPSYRGLGLNLCKALYGSHGAATAPFYSYDHQGPAVPGDTCYDPEAAVGSAIGGIAFAHGSSFPAPYDDALYFADPVRACIYVMSRGSDGRPDPTTARVFLSGAGPYAGVDLEFGPEGDLYYVQLAGENEGEGGSIHRISYDPDAPIARLSANPLYGPTPLHVEFDAGGSTDPNGEALTYEWDLDGDGSFETSGAAVRSNTFSDAFNVTVAVRVSNGKGKSSVAMVTVYPGDSPPRPTITVPTADLTWGVGQEVHFAGFAKDDEDAPGAGHLDADQLFWRTRLYHCPFDGEHCHAHPLQVFAGIDQGDLLAPDHDYPSFLEFELVASDSRGLIGSTSVRIDPRTVELRLESDPPGLPLGAGLLSRDAPFTLTAIEGSNVVLAAPPKATWDGAEHAFRSWSDGGARVHTVIADESATYRASYRDGAERPPAPQARIRRRPARRTTKTSARFAFAADRAGARFECRLGGAPWHRCRSPRVFRHLRPGRHVFRLRAVDPSDGAVGRVVRFAWRVIARGGKGRGVTRVSGA